LPALNCTFIEQSSLPHLSAFVSNVGPCQTQYSIFFSPLTTEYPIDAQRRSGANKQMRHRKNKQAHENVHISRWLHCQRREFGSCTLFKNNGKIRKCICQRCSSAIWKIRAHPMHKHTHTHRWRQAGSSTLV